MDILPVDSAIDDAPNKVGRPVRDVSEWGPAFLKGVRKSGNISRSARKARVSPTTVRKWARAHPEFARKISGALREYGDRLEENLGELAFKGNAVANIARLKGLNDRLARKYSEKAVDNRVINLTVNQGQSAPPDADAMLTRIFARMGADEQAAMLGKPYELPERTAAEIIDVTPEETP
jgi:transposase-like protein